METNNPNRQGNRALPHPNQPQQQKKSRGNRRNQRFRRQCRAQKMKPEEIEKRLRNRNQINPNNQRTMDHRPNTTLNQVSIVQTNNPSNQTITAATSAMITHSNKRKRDVSAQLESTIPKSTSTISILQPSLKKLKKKRKINTIPLKKMKNNIIQLNYRFVFIIIDIIIILIDIFFFFFASFCSRRPMYLKRSSATLFQMLSKTLDYNFKEKEQQKYIYIRLNLLDQQYCLKVDQQLWQSYLDIGVQQHIWPVSFIVLQNLFDSKYFFVQQNKLGSIT